MTAKQTTNLMGVFSTILAFLCLGVWALTNKTWAEVGAIINIVVLMATFANMKGEE